MKKNLLTIYGVITILIMCISPMLYSQSVYKIYESKDIDMKLSGTSTLHKWTMDTKTFDGDGQFNFKPGTSDILISIKNLNFSLAVQDLKSGEKGLDKNAYKALKSDQYKDIDYKLTSAIVSPGTGNKYLVKTHGNLTIAGVTKQIIMDIACIVNKDGTITCTGSYKLEMTDYQVKPPTFILGAMKTGDAITLDFTLVYKK